MKRPLAILFVFLLSFCILHSAFCTPALADLAGCLDATCRISTPGGSRGTGCAFEHSQGHVFVLTAAHVVGRHRTVHCEFWRDGHRSAPLSAEVIARNESADAAVVCLPAGSFGGVLPSCIPIAPRGYRLSQGETVTSVGCAKGAWATGWKGHVVGYFGGSLCFTPPPADGRSGSALFDAAGEKIVGMVFGRSDGEVFGRSDGQRRGYAVTVENLYRALNFKQTAAGWVHSPLSALAYDEQYDEQKAQCGPNGCTPRGNILPYRNQQQQREYQRDRRLDELDRRLQFRDQVWPTLPAQSLRLEAEIDRRGEAAKDDAAQRAKDQLTARPSGLGVALSLAAALGIGVFLFYAVGKQ